MRQLSSRIILVSIGVCIIYCLIAFFWISTIVIEIYGIAGPNSSKNIAIIVSFGFLIIRCIWGEGSLILFIIRVAVDFSSRGQVLVFLVASENKQNK